MGDRLKSLFDERDTNKDGHLDRTEFERMVKMQEPCSTEEQLSEMFQRLDRDGDGTITLEEMYVAMNSIQDEGKEDGDRDGKDGNENWDRERILRSPSMITSAGTSDGIEVIIDDDWTLSDEEKTLKNTVRDLVGEKMEISESQFWEIMKDKLDGMDKEAVFEIFKNLDSDSSGSVSFDELLEVFREMESEDTDASARNALLLEDHLSEDRRSISDHRTNISLNTHDDDEEEKKIPMLEKIRLKYIDEIRKADRQISILSRKCEEHEATIKKILTERANFEAKAQMLESKLGGMREESTNRDSMLLKFKETYESEYDELLKKYHEQGEIIERERKETQVSVNELQAEVKSLKKQLASCEKSSTQSDNKINRMSQKIKQLLQERNKAREESERLREREETIIREHSDLTFWRSQHDARDGKDDMSRNSSLSNPTTTEGGGLISMSTSLLDDITSTQQSNATENKVNSLISSNADAGQDSTVVLPASQQSVSKLPDESLPSSHGEGGEEEEEEEQEGTMVEVGKRGVEGDQSSSMNSSSDGRRRRERESIAKKKRKNPATTKRPEAAPRCSSSSSSSSSSQTPLQFGTPGDKIGRSERRSSSSSSSPSPPVGGDSTTSTTGKKPSSMEEQSAVPVSAFKTISSRIGSPAYCYKEGMENEHSEGLHAKDRGSHRRRRSSSCSSNNSKSSSSSSSNSSSSTSDRKQERRRRPGNDDIDDDQEGKEEGSNDSPVPGATGKKINKNKNKGRGVMIENATLVGLRSDKLDDVRKAALSKSSLPILPEGAVAAAIDAERKKIKNKIRRLQKRLARVEKERGLIRKEYDIIEGRKGKEQCGTNCMMS